MAGHEDAGALVHDDLLQHAKEVDAENRIHARCHFVEKIQAWFMRYGKRQLKFQALSARHSFVDFSCREIHGIHDFEKRFLMKIII